MDQHECNNHDESTDVPVRREPSWRQTCPDSGLFDLDGAVLLELQISEFTFGPCTTHQDQDRANEQAQDAEQEQEQEQEPEDPAGSSSSSGSWWWPSVALGLALLALRYIGTF